MGLPGGETVSSSPPFELFGADHGTALVVVVLSTVAGYLWGRSAGRDGGDRRAAILLAVLLIIVELVKPWLAIGVYQQPWAENLPLHLCRISTLLTAVMLLSRSYRLFEVAYFWVLGGGIPALLTPDLAHGFPHPMFFAYFVGHGLTLTAILFAVPGFGFRPRLASIGLTVIASLGLMLVVIPVNALLDTNYLYLREKPPEPSLYDFLGPWPWYIVSTWLVGLLLCLATYAPFPILQYLRKHRPGKTTDGR